MGVSNLHLLVRLDYIGAQRESASAESYDTYGSRLQVRHRRSVYVVALVVEPDPFLFVFGLYNLQLFYIRVNTTTEQAISTSWVCFPAVEEYYLSAGAQLDGD